MSQTNLILEYLKRGNTLTPLEALDRFGCFRLSARIENCRKKGENIKTEIIEDKGKRYAKYSYETK